MSANALSKVWYIAKYQNGNTFYVSDTDNNTVLWSRFKKNALQFKTEHGVQHFITVLLHRRTDIFLVYGNSE